MKILILAVITALSLGLGTANADPATHAASQPNTEQLNITAGAAGWG